MDKNYTQLQKRVAELEKQMLNLQQSNTLPLNVEKALRARGFLNENDMHFGVSSTTIGNPTYIELPFATQQSIAMVTSIVSTGAFNVQGEVVPSLTNPSGYALLVYSSNAADIFSYVVFNFKGRWLTDPN